MKARSQGYGGCSGSLIAPNFLLSLDKVPCTRMYEPRKTDWVSSMVTAGLGAGIITSFAVSQGQSPWLGLGITAFAAIAAVLIDRIATSLGS